VFVNGWLVYEHCSSNTYAKINPEEALENLGLIRHVKKEEDTLRIFLRTIFGKKSLKEEEVKKEDL